MKIAKGGWSMVQIEQITTLPELDNILEDAKGKLVLLFKHSTTCPISAYAYEQVQRLSQTDEVKEMRIALIHVIENRSLSNEVAHRFQIKHESPQAFLIQAGKVVWHASHRNITQSAILEAKRLAESSG
jgi:bacillithiol system protein YtxJ